MRARPALLTTALVCTVLATAFDANADTLISSNTTWFGVTAPRGTTTIASGVTLTILGSNNFVAQSDRIVNFGTIHTVQSSLQNAGTLENHGTFIGSLQNGILRGTPLFTATFDNYGSFSGSFGNSIRGAATNRAGGVFTDEGFGINWGVFVNDGYFQTYNPHADWLGFHNSQYFDPSNPGIRSTFTNNGHLVVLAGGNFHAAASTLINHGTISVIGELEGSSFALFDNFGTLENWGLWTNHQTTSTSHGTVRNYGTIFNDHTIRSRQNSSFTNEGVIDNAGAFDADSPFDNNGTIENRLIFTNRGRMENDGTINNRDRFDNFGFASAPGELINRGTLANYGAFRNADLVDNYNHLLNASGATFSALGDGLVINRCGATLENLGSFPAAIDDEDADRDGLCRPFDNCPTVANVDQTNADGDLFGDVCDACPVDPQNDVDRDGRCGDVDNCPSLANPGQENADGDAFGDACDPCRFDALNDADADGRCADVDNCPLQSNADQLDTDSDALGNVCDDDDDGDGLTDAVEASIGSNPLDTDSDDDGLEDGTEVGMAGGGTCPSPIQADSDGDTLIDGVELAQGTNFCSVDTDGDAVRDNEDPRPTQPGVTVDWLLGEARGVATAASALDLSLIDAPNPNAAANRRDTLANQIAHGADALSLGNINAAISHFTNALRRVDGSPPKDWVLDSPEQDALKARLERVLALIALGFLP